MKAPEFPRARLQLPRLLWTIGTTAVLASWSNPGRAVEAPGQTANQLSSPKNGNVSQQPADPAQGTNAGPGLVVEGERFTVRQVIDRQQGGMAVCAFAAPEKWRDKSQVNWNYAYTSNPVNMAVSIENPANEEAYYQFQNVGYFCLTPDYGQYKPGRNSLGLIELKQQPPAPTLLNLIRQARGSFAKLKVIGTKDLPDLPKALKIPSSGTQRGVGVKVTYELNGKPVEEEFYAVYYSLDIPYDGPQGRTWEKHWGLNAVHSFRAPLGKLDGRRNVFSAIAKSWRPNPAWQQRLAAINAYLTEQFNRQLQAGYDSIAAAGRLSQQISANNDAMIASIDRQLQASRASSSAGSGSASRSSTDHFDDYIRGVETVDDPYWGTSQHSANEQYHWTDGYGTYRNSNDPTYNPNQHENGDWQLMQPAR